MSQENETNVNNVPAPEVNTEGQSNQIYLDAIAKLKSTTVSVDKYNQLQAENKNLLDAILEGNTSTDVTPKEEVLTAAQCRQMLFTPDHELNDIEYVTNALQLREAVLRETGEDCFVPKAHNYVPSNEAFESAQRTADVLKQCVDYANGDNALFINELQRRMNDIRIPSRQK